MLDPIQDLTRSLDLIMARHAAETGYAPPTRDQVNARVQTYLRQRGQAIATDLGLGQVQPDDLAELGRLDVLAEMPDTDPALAPVLAMVVAEREASFTPPWPRPAPNPSLGPRPKKGAPERRPGLEQGRGDHVARGGQETAEENGKVDPVTDYLKNVRDPDDDDWRPM
jgi:hypothetical protein